MSRIVFTMLTFCLWFQNVNASNPDSLLPIIKKTAPGFSFDRDSLLDTSYTDPQMTQSVANLTAMIENNVSNRKYKRIMLHLIRVLKIKRSFRNEKTNTRLYNNLAGISAKMKLYPLAMQFCYQEMQDRITLNFDDSVEEEISTTANDIPGIDSTLSFTEAYSTEKSTPVSTAEILQSFNDNKEATDYALIIHVKQPVHGKRKAFTKIDNVGHMFITLIKYNSDQTYVSRSFGFYPNKNGLFAATPLQPGTPSTLKDDALHDWDEAVGKFISYRRFFKIIKLLARYEYKPYHLNENNCTDFGLSIASLSGIQIKETTGKWPFGKGNNPANAGQSILENKLSAELPGETPDFFVFKK